MGEVLSDTERQGAVQVAERIKVFRPGRSSGGGGKAAGRNRVV
jgi:hypothetical protein